MPEMTAVLETVHTHSIAQEIHLAATPAAIYTALTTDIGFWWGPPYSHGEPTDIVLEPTIGGRFMQTQPDGGGSLWCTVTRIEPGSILELRGHMGMGAPVMGVICFELEPREDGTLLKLSHVFTGPVPAETREGYHGGWQDLLGTRLRGYVEQGTRCGVRK